MSHDLDVLDAQKFFKENPTGIYIPFNARGVFYRDDDGTINYVEIDLARIQNMSNYEIREFLKEEVDAERKSVIAEGP